MTPEAMAEQLPNYRRIELWAALAALMFLVLIIETIRRHRLKERYSLLWFATIIAVIVLTVRREWLDEISYGLGIHHAPSALLLIWVGFMMLMLFHFSTVISRLLNDRNALAQRVGILDARYRLLKRQLSELRAEASATDDGSEPDEDT